MRTGLEEWPRCQADWPRWATTKLRAALIAELQARVLDAKDLYGDIHIAHVNCEGPLFLTLHPFLGDLYGAVGGHADTLGERIRQLGGMMLGASKTVAERSTVAPYPETLTDGAVHAREVCERVVALCATLRTKTLRLIPGETEPVTYQLVLDVLIDLEKRSWMLAALAPVATTAGAPGSGG